MRTLPILTMALTLLGACSSEVAESLASDSPASSSVTSGKQATDSKATGSKVSGSKAASGSEDDKSCCSEELSAAPLPSTSLYQLESKWTDQDGSEHRLTDFRGQPCLVAMIFTHCSYACPQLLSDIKAIEAGLPKTENKDFRVLLMSMDAERDTPEVLKAYASTNNLDKRWTLLHGSAGDVRELAAVLGVNYIKQSTGDYSHSNIISVLDRDGIVVHRQEGLAASPELTLSKWLAETARTH